MSLLKATVRATTFLSFSWLVLSINSPNSFPGGSVPVETRSLDEIYAAAKAEAGPLTVSWGGDETNQADSVKSLWKSRFPEIELNLTVDVSKYHDSNIDRSIAKGAEYVDVAFLQTLHDFERWKMQGRLLKYKPAAWNQLYEALKSPDGSYFAGFFFSTFGLLTYNPSLISNTSIPSTYADFINPIWRSKLVLTYPNDDDAVLYLFTLIVEKYGWDWAETLAHSQDVRWVRGTQTPATILSSNTTINNDSRPLSFTTTPSGLLASKTPEDAYMSWGQTGAIFASTKRPESAKLFMNWLVSDEYQRNLAEEQGADFLVRKDLVGITRKGRSIWDDGVTDPLGFWKFMVQREKVEWWKLQFETLLGTAQGASPLHDEI